MGSAKYSGACGSLDDAFILLDSPPNQTAERRHLRDQSQAIIGVTDPIKFKADYETFRPAPDDKLPTVLQVLPALVSGGVERGTIEIAEALIEAGWRAMVVSSGGPMVREL